MICTGGGILRGWLASGKYIEYAVAERTEELGDIFFRAAR